MTQPDAVATELQGQKILVTGGAGFIGSHMVELLVGHNEVVVVDDLSQGSRRNLVNLMDHPGFSLVEGSVTDLEHMTCCCRDVDVVFHLAAVNIRRSIQDPVGVEEVCARGTLNMCEAARRNKVSCFVYCSSSEVYGTAFRVPMSEEHPLNPRTVYGAAKLAGEHYTLAYHRTYGMATMVVRPFNTYGPREVFSGVHGEVIPRFSVLAWNARPLTVFGEGAQTRDFMHVSDCARGIVQAATCRQLVGSVANIGSGSEISIAELAELILREYGQPQGLIKSAGHRPGDVLRLYADPSRAAAAFGFRTNVQIEEGIASYRRWLEGEWTPAEALATVQERNW